MAIFTYLTFFVYFIVFDYQVIAYSYLTSDGKYLGIKIFVKLVHSL